MSAAIDAVDESAPLRFTFVADWQAMDPAEGEAITAFWRSENAMQDDAQMKARLPQVVMHARDGDKVAAVCTAIAMIPPQFGQPVYYYRSFVGKAWRTTTVIEQLLRRAVKLLEDYAAAHGFPCIGILLELEGARFADKGRMPVWPRSGFVYIGKSGRGLESRIRYFKGARLKPAKT
ncbi:MAG TPA: hypothetical protein VHE32_12095 [Rhodanobacteraceae bacterium]|nr:hypothetical protein [Rhodanobacteraceae bacterium]